MSPRTSTLVLFSILSVTRITCGQETIVGNDDNAKGSTPGVADLLQFVNVSDMLQIAVELRKTSESLERFGKSMQSVSSVAAKAASSTSQNLAAIGGEFDPFGFKTAFETIQQQNDTIQAQHQIIVEMQQKEIRRLEQKNRSEKRSKRPSRRKKPSRDLKKPDAAEVSE